MSEESTGGIFTSLIQNAVKKAFLETVTAQNIGNLLTNFCDSLKGLAGKTANTYDDWVVDHAATLLLQDSAITSITTFLRNMVSGAEYGTPVADYDALAREILQVPEGADDSREAGSLSTVASLAQLLATILPILIGLFTQKED